VLQKYPELEAEFTNASVESLGFMPMGAGRIQTTEKEVKTMAGMNCLILECHAGEAAGQALQLIGATPEQIDPSEGFDALAKGIVNGTIGE
jgi:TRAP-type C4-dicarboxylate transport system substrate-binding protein